MAVTPQELVALTPDDVAAVGRIERIIDDKLQINYEPGGRAVINIANAGEQVKCPRITFKMRQELISRYEKAGWAIVFDPNNPDFLTFDGPVKAPPRPDIVPTIGVDQILDKMQEKAKENGGTTAVKPPSFTPTTRETSPYSRAKLNSRP